MRKLFFVAALLIGACGYDPGPAPAGMEGLWDKAREDAPGARDQVEAHQRGLWWACDGTTSPGEAAIYSSNPTQCIETSGNWNQINDLAYAYWPTWGNSMHPSTGGQAVTSTAVQSASGRFMMVRNFGSAGFSTSGGYEQICAKNGWGQWAGNGFVPRSLYAIEDAIGGGAPVNPCVGN